MATAKHKAVFSLMAVGLVFGICEVASFTYFHFVQPKLGKAAPFRESCLPVKHSSSNFDAELGWIDHRDSRPILSPHARSFGRPYWATYGDSFTYGVEVEAHETFQYLVESKIGADILNYGVGAFGPDQALLRAVREKRGFPLASLGFISENINRVENVFRPFYQTPTSFFTKPRFLLRDGKLILVPNPVKSYEELLKLDDRDLPRLAEHDYFAPFWSARPKLDFPYTRHLFNRRVWKPGEIPWLWMREESRALLFAIFERFAREMEAVGSHPLILLMPMRDDVEAMEQMQGKDTLVQIHFAKFCAEKKISCFDGVRCFHRATNHTPIEKLYAPGRHLTAKGNAMLAGCLEEFIVLNGLAPPLIKTRRASNHPR